MPVPKLPHAEEVAQQVSGVLSAWAATRRGKPPRIVISGEPGSGKTQVLDLVAGQLEGSAATTVQIAPPTLDFDTPLQTALQGAGALRASGMNGLLNPAFELETKVDIKLRALEQGLCLKPTVLFFDLPRFEGSKEKASSPEVALARTASMAFVERLSRLDEGGPALVITERERLPFSNELQRFSVKSTSAEAFLEPTQWGQLGDSARTLMRRLGNDASKVSPLGLRIGVALVELGQGGDKVARTVRLGMPMLLNFFRRVLESEKVLARALRCLSAPRVPVSHQAISALIELANATEYDLILRRVLLVESHRGSILPSAIRETVPSRGDDPREDEELSRQAHSSVRRLSPPVAEISSRENAISLLEYVFHSARLGDFHAVEKYALDGSQFIMLGRSLSRAGRYDDATNAFSRAWELTREVYALQYRAFNRERARGVDRSVEEDYREAVTLEPTNPWWNRRYIMSLLARGKVDEARTALSTAVEHIRDSNDEAWLARNFYTGIVRAFLDRSLLDDAEFMLETLSPDSFSDELHALENELRHRQESRRLQGAVFPLSVDYEARWTNGPHLATDIERGECSSWYPARIVELGLNEVTIEFCEPPDETEEPVLLKTTVSAADFLAGSEQKISDLREGMFIELLEFPNDERRVKFHPSTASRLRLFPNPLRRFDVSEAGA